MTFLNRTFILCVFFLQISLSGYSQKKYHHNLFWGRVVLADTINSRLKWEIWLQRRTQNADGTKIDIFEAPQFSTVWLWLNYNLSKDLKLSITPFSYFKSWPLYVKPSDLEAQPIKEFRWVARVDQQNRLKYFNLINRLAVEYRYRDMMNTNVYTPNYRLRYMLRFEKSINTTALKRPLLLIANDEVMVQFGKSVKNNASLFDQNRIYVGFNYEIFRNVKLNLGYLYTIQERPSGKEFDYINTLWTIVTFDNIFSQFYPKKKNRI